MSIEWLTTTRDPFFTHVLQQNSCNSAQILRLDFLRNELQAKTNIWTKLIPDYSAVFGRLKLFGVQELWHAITQWKLKINKTLFFVTLYYLLWKPLFCWPQERAGSLNNWIEVSCLFFKQGIFWCTLRCSWSRSIDQNQLVELLSVLHAEEQNTCTEPELHRITLTGCFSCVRFQVYLPFEPPSWTLLNCACLNSR